MAFVGPDAGLLTLFGDKVRARAAASAAGLAVLAGSDTATDVDGARSLLETHGAVMLKAVAGGGGRGMRAVTDRGELEAAFERCVSEAKTAFGDPSVYAEQLVTRARHVEVQIVGDGTDVVALGERECSVQRRNQKLIEIAPAPGLPPGLRRRLAEAAVTLGRSVGYRSLGTVEFLLDASTPPDDDTPFWFIETNARIQVEHTVTEEVTGVDLVETQLRLAAGWTLAEVGLDSAAAAAADGSGLGSVVTPQGWSIQARINAEITGSDGLTRPSSGTITRFDLPGGPGVRVDTASRPGAVVNPAFDSLLAKLIVTHRAASFDDARRRLYRALCETMILGVDTNLDVLRNIVSHDGFMAATTSFLADHLVELVAPGNHRLASTSSPGEPAAGGAPSRAGAALGSDDPLAVLDFGRVATVGASSAVVGADGSATPAGHQGAIGEGRAAVVTPLQGTVVTVEVVEGDLVRAGQLVAVIEAMKMEHEVRAAASGTVERVAATPGDTLWADQLLVVLAVGDDDGSDVVEDEDVDLDEIRPSLAEALELRARMMDDARPDAVERRHTKGLRTARENLADLIDEGTFVEYGPVALAAQRRRRTREDLINRSPADGLITGVASINGALFDEPDNRCAVMLYDYTVFAGTQGIRNHAKTDRIIDVATEGRLPFILYAEGGGGRPGDTDGGDFGSRTFSRFATMSGLVPMVGVVAGYCFAGNASLLGCCDVIIATRDSNIGMGGPAMIEGGGLGVFRPDEIGPSPVHVDNGVIDVLVDNEAEATAVAREVPVVLPGPGGRVGGPRPAAAAASGTREPTPLL